MKKLTIGLALVAMTAVPALAAPVMTQMRDGHRVVVSSQPRADVDVYAEGGVMVPGAEANEAYAYAPAPMIAGSPPVFAFGEYQGADPDPFIRHSLQRDPTSPEND